MKRSPKIRHGQKGVARPLIGTYDTSDRAIQERRKQQQRFRDAQLIQREMGQLERQYEELEEVGRQIEQCLRDTEGSKLEEGERKRGEEGRGRVDGRRGQEDITVILTLSLSPSLPHPHTTNLHSLPGGTVYEVMAGACEREKCSHQENI